ncbi:MAG: 50S ribosomal protein L24 [Helicobacteraceae bacterium]|jgi:large subunit ribosomal protein L24|nr:50S ribosomal protein L24 [Helicobacteraceae bacterium]
MAKFAIKKGDLVRVIAGEGASDKKATHKVLKVMPKTSQVVVEGINVVKKAVKPSEKNKEGGFARKEKPINISNVKKAEG